MQKQGNLLKKKKKNFSMPYKNTTKEKIHRNTNTVLSKKKTNFPINLSTLKACVSGFVFNKDFYSQMEIYK